MCQLENSGCLDTVGEQFKRRWPVLTDDVKITIFVVDKNDDEDNDDDEKIKYIKQQ